MRWFNGMKQILQAHGAVCMKLPWLAFVIQKGNTRGACVTVHVTIVAFVYSTDAALVAMIIPSLRPIIKEVARCAEIRRELDAACSVAARLRRFPTFFKHDFKQSPLIVGGFCTDLPPP
jgi:hypothetical protein